MKAAVGTRPTVDASSYPQLTTVQSRWSDNDLFGHLNNAVYYELFDSEINRHLSRATGLAPNEFPLLGVVAESSCRFRSEVSFPADLRVGLAVERLGRTSVTYALALFAEEDPWPAAEARWVHVYVDRATRRPAPIPDVVRTCLEPLVWPTSTAPADSSRDE